MRITRIGDGPIIGPDTDPSIGTNIQGPSLVRVPDWVTDPLGRYHLYFADHKGAYIRLAYADEIRGPWTVHWPGSLRLEHSTFLTEPPHATEDQLAALSKWYVELLGSSTLGDALVVDATTPHIASPDVHIDEAKRRFVMYFHGLADLGVQVTKAATSTNGIDFVGRPEVVGPPYVRAFRYDGMTYAVAMPGTISRSVDGLRDFEHGPNVFVPEMRHSAVCKRGDLLHVFWTRVGDAPESILHSTIDLSGDWNRWAASEPAVVLRPERDWEGADAPVKPSRRSVAHGHVNQLRDPAVFDDVDGRSYLLYAVAGESGIALAEIDWDATAT